MGGVHKHHTEQVDGGRGGEDPPAVAERNQARQQSGMVQVGVGEEHEVDPAQLEIQRIAVLAVGFAPALEEPAIHQECTVLVIDAQAGSGDLASGTEKGELHRRSR